MRNLALTNKVLEKTFLNCYTARGHKLNFAGVTKLALCGAKQALRLQFVPSRGIYEAMAAHRRNNNVSKWAGLLASF